jgi:hypothetical protein
MRREKGEVMNTVYILHYEQIGGSHEYIVLTEDNSPENIETCRKPSYGFYKAYEFEGDSGTLPLDRALSAD